jgi:hypothetical protein
MMYHFNEIKGIKTKTYDAGQGFRVDVIHDKERKETEAYLYHKDCAMKEIMFRSAGIVGIDDVMDDVGKNINEYILNYADAYMIA